jgi:putative nucleotidyltransferase with HDIG domain
VVVATGLVIVLPAVLVAAVVPARGPVSWAASAVAAMALSLTAARVGAAYWVRRPGSRDLIFADLMAWGWVRRTWAERRLTHARRSLAKAEKAGDPPRVEDLQRLSRTLEARDAYTHGHSQRVARHAESIARNLHLSRDEIATVRTAAAVHDIGKLHTPRDILNKPDRLTDEEFAIIKRHPVDGADMLRNVGDPELVAMVRHHHERLDGAGYPDGLVGKAIPIGARIIAVADTFDAITSSRSYRSSGTHKKALDILSAEGGKQLDGEAVAAFRSYYSGRRGVVGTALVAAMPERLLAWLGQATHALGSAAASVAQAFPAVGVAALLGASSGLPAHSTPQRQAPAATTPVTRPLTVASDRSVTTPRSARGGHARSPDRPVNGVDHGRSPTAPSPTPASQPTTTQTQAATPTVSAEPPSPEPPHDPARPPPSPPTRSLPDLPVPVDGVPVVPTVTVPSVTVPAVELPVVPVTTPAVTLPSLP